MKKAMDILSTIGTMGVWVYGAVFLVSMVGGWTLKIVTRGKYPKGKMHRNDIRQIRFVGGPIVFLVWAGVVIINRLNT